jgi:hypothetical protein
LDNSNDSGDVVGGGMADLRDRRTDGCRETPKILDFTLSRDVRVADQSISMSTPFLCSIGQLAQSVEK